MSASRFLAAAAICALAACGGSPAAPATGSPTSTSASADQLRVLGDPVVTLSLAGSVALSLEEHDSAGRTVTASPQSYTWTSSAPGIVSAGADGVLHAADLGQAVITVRSTAGRTATVRVWVQLPANAPQTYHITLVFADDTPAEWRAELAAAAAQWETIIRGELPPAAVVVDPSICSGIPGEPPMPPFPGPESGTRIYVGSSSEYPPTYVEATGGPCVQRPVPFPTTVLGIITINRNKPVSKIPPDRLHYVATHEMGHVLGLVGIFQRIQMPWFDQTNGIYTGPMALEGYRRRYTFTTTQLSVVGGHWVAASDDVMGLSGLSVITPISIGGLMDMGYRAVW